MQGITHRRLDNTRSVKLLECCSTVSNGFLTQVNCASTNSAVAVRNYAGACIRMRAYAALHWSTISTFIQVLQLKDSPSAAFFAASLTSLPFSDSQSAASSILSLAAAVVTRVVRVTAEAPVAGAKKAAAWFTAATAAMMQMTEREATILMRVMSLCCRIELSHTKCNLGFSTMNFKAPGGISQERSSRQLACSFAQLVGSSEGLLLEGDNFEVSQAVFDMCGWATTAQEVADSSGELELTVPITRTHVLRHVVEFCNHYVEEPMNEIEKPLRSANMHEVVQS
eukprot:3625-Heterococcus_DN1.PRE.1